MKLSPFSVGLYKNGWKEFTRGGTLLPYGDAAWRWWEEKKIRKKRGREKYRMRKRGVGTMFTIISFKITYDMILKSLNLNKVITTTFTYF